jgi:hypothetical protein
MAREDIDVCLTSVLLNRISDSIFRHRKRRISTPRGRIGRSPAAILRRYWCLTINNIVGRMVLCIIESLKGEPLNLASCDFFHISCDATPVVILYPHIKYSTVYHQAPELEVYIFVRLSGVKEWTAQFAEAPVLARSKSGVRG